MYHADSDILSIVIGILTLVFGACSSFAGKKKKRAKTKEEHRAESGEVEMHDTQTPIEGERTTVDNPWEFVSAEKCAMESQSLGCNPSGRAFCRDSCGAGRAGGEMCGGAAGP